MRPPAELHVERLRRALVNTLRAATHGAYHAFDRGAREEVLADIELLREHLVLPPPRKGQL